MDVTGIVVIIGAVGAQLAILIPMLNRNRSASRDAEAAALEAKATAKRAATDAQAAKETGEKTHQLVNGQHSKDMEFQAQLLKLLADRGIVAPPAPGGQTTATTTGDPT